MQKENNLTAGQWCDHWFTANRHKWNSNTEGGYRNLIYSHIIPSIGGVVLSGLTKQTIINFYDSLRSQGLGARSVWCVHLLLRRCMDEAAQDQLIPYNPVRLCQEPKAEEYKTAPLRLGQLQRYLNAAEQLGVLPLIYTGLSQPTCGHSSVAHITQAHHRFDHYFSAAVRLLIVFRQTIPCGICCLSSFR